MVDQVLQRRIEREVMERLESIGNPLKWRPEMRDEEGHGILRFDTHYPDGRIRIARMKITPRGTLHDEQFIEPEKP